MLLFTGTAIVSAGSIGALGGFLGVELANWMPSLHFFIWYLVSAAALVYGLIEARGIQWPVPQIHWQVPKDWGKHGRPLFAIGFGLVLGPGFFTFVSYIGYHLLLIVCIVIADPIHSAVLMAIFGASRAAPILFPPVLASMERRRYTFEAAIAVNEWIMRREPILQRLRAISLLAIAGSAIAAGSVSL